MQSKHYSEVKIMQYASAVTKYRISEFVANAYIAGPMLPLMFDSILFDYSVFCIF